jgi:site-specific DNA-cytosine methylase
LFIGGSPCQGFSFAGKQLNFNDPRSRLFFEFAADLRFIQEFVNEDVEFLLENVKMKKEYQDIISKFLGVEPIKINSSLLSAQNRERYYWTNIKNISIPDDKGILLKDILECKSEDYIKISKKGVYKKYQEKSSTLTAGANSGGNHSDMDLIGIKKTCLQIGEASDINGHDILKRIYSEFGKSPTLSTCGGGNRQPKVAINDYEYRRLTPLEFERLQTVPDKYTEGVSNSQRYKMLGNGWTVDVIAHIFKNLS